MDGACARVRRVTLLAAIPAHIYCVLMSTTIQTARTPAKVPHEPFGNLLLELRRKAGIATQADLARLVKSRQQTVSRWEAGLSRPRDTQMPLIAQVLDAKVDDLLKAAGYVTKRIVATFDQPFPIDALSSDSFERFCFHFLLRLYPNAKVHRAGASGHTQEGLDIEVTLPGNKRHTFQCKRVDEFGPAKVDKAIRDHTRKAQKKFILLTRIASPQARDAVQRHAGWDIWDKEDVSLRIRSLPKHEQINLVDRFFRGQRLALLGELEPGPWQTPDEFFAPFLTGHGAFSHTWRLVGKTAEVKALVHALRDDGVRAIFLTGAGGSGKSRVLKEAVDAVQSSSPSLIAFLSPSEDVTSKSLEDLGVGRKVLIVDDAHDRTDLDLLFQFAAMPENNAVLLLAFRPYGLDYLKAQASSFSLAGPSVREIRVEPLSPDEATALARQVLEQHSGPTELAKHIGRLTRDCPLATVAGAMVIAKDQRPLGLVGNEDTFRATLLGRFHTVIAGEIGGKTDADSLRKLLRMLALLQPFHPDDQAVISVAEQIEQLPPHEFHRLARLLIDAGVLFKRGGKYRLSPDLLGDHIIEGACIAEGGGSTGYAERVFDGAGDAYLQHVLFNLGKLDWRRANGDPSNSRLLDGVWAKLSPRSDYVDPHVAAVSAVAYYQPKRALDFVEALIRKHEFLREVPIVIKHAAYNLEHVQRACECLWQIGKDDERELGPQPNHAMRILAELCAVEPNKPLNFNEVVVDFGLSLLDNEHSLSGPYTPFDFLEGILAAEGHTTTSNGRAISWNRFNVSPEAVAPLRRKVVDKTVALLTHRNVRVGVLAARFLQKAIQYGMNATLETLKAWTKEFVDTLERIESVLRTTSLDPLVLIQIAFSVGWHAQNDQRGTSAAAKRVLEAMPDSFELRTYTSLLNAYGAWRDPADYHALTKEIGERITALVREWLEVYATPEELRSALAEAMHHVIKNAPPKSTTSTEFQWYLIRASLGLAHAIAENAIADPASPTRRCAGLALAKIMFDDRDAALGVADRFFAEGSTDLAGAIGHAYWIVGLKDASPKDLANVGRLLASNDEQVVLSTLGILRTVAGDNARYAIDLVAQINLGISARVTEEVLSVFYDESKTPFSLFTEADIEHILRGMEAVAELDGHWIDTFLSRASRYFPRLTADFFIRRIDRAADSNDWSIRPCNFGPYGHVPLRFRETAESAGLLRKVSTWMNSRAPQDILFHERAKQLFGAMFSPFDDALVEFLQDWVRVATEGDMRTIAHILDEAPNALVFRHRKFVEEVLHKAKQFGQKTFDRFVGVLYGSAISGLRTGTPGEPFPQDVQMKADAEAALKDVTRFSPAYEVYDEIRKCAVDRIARSLREAERFEE
jgi:transcriptional regulator with XRE-family HTH domain